jgi:hypothetical protein
MANKGKRENIGVSIRDIVDHWGGSEPVELPAGTETPLQVPPNGIIPVDPVNDIAIDRTPVNAANIEPVPADNNLLLFGGLAAFYLVAFAPIGKRKVSGISPGWLMPGLLLGGVLAFLALKKPGANEELAALNTWADINRAPGEAADAIKQIFARMTPAEIHDTHTYLIDYVGTGTPLDEAGDLWPRITAIAQKYHIFS